MAVVRTRRVIDDEGASAVTSAAERAANEKRYPVVIAVVDPWGELIELHRTEGAGTASANRAVDRARTAVGLNALTSAAVADTIGGVLLKVDGEAVGAVGTSGETPELDESVSLAGARAKLSTVEVPALTYEGARFAAEGVGAVAAEWGVAAVVSVVDPGGELVYLLRPNAATAAHMKTAIGNARSAAVSRRPSEPGGIPIEYQGRVIGAVGVSGANAADQDHELARIGAKAAADGRYRPYRFAGGLIYLNVSESPAMRRRAEGLYEPTKVAAVQRLVKPGMTFLDIGSNKGDFALIAARAMNDRGRILAFEPMPDNSGWIRESIALNGYRSIRLLEVALSDSEGRVPLYLGEWSGTHSFLPFANGPGDFIEVPTRTLDSVLAESDDNAVDVMKIDVEGAELQVLRGAERTLAERRAMAVLVDVHPRRGVDPAEVWRLLAGHGFSFRDPRDMDTTLSELPERVHELYAVRDGGETAAMGDLDARGVA